MRSSYERIRLDHLSISRRRVHWIIQRNPNYGFFVLTLSIAVEMKLKGRGSVKIIWFVVCEIVIMEERFNKVITHCSAGAKEPTNDDRLINLLKNDAKEDTSA